MLVNETETIKAEPRCKYKLAFQTISLHWDKEIWRWAYKCRLALEALTSHVQAKSFKRNRSIQNLFGLWSKNIVTLTSEDQKQFLIPRYIIVKSDSSAVGWRPARLCKISHKIFTPEMDSLAANKKWKRLLL